MVNVIANKNSSIRDTSVVKFDTPHYSGSVPWLYCTNKRRLTQRQNSPFFPQAKFLQRWGVLIQARNINYQTLTENLPVATTTAEIWPFPNIVATLQRIANIVTIQVPSSVTNVAWTGTMEDVGVKIPEGFRPIENTTMTTQWQDGTNTDVNFVFTPNGNSLVSQRTMGQTRWIGASCWITNDDWPSSS